MVKAVIFDLDDLLVDSHYLHELATEITLREMGWHYPKISDQDQRRYIGMRVQDILQEMSEKMGNLFDFQELSEKRAKTFQRLVEEQLQPLPGAEQALRLCQKEKVLTALATSGTKSYVKIVLHKFGWEKFFSVIVCGDEVKLGKPDPETYLVAVQKLKQKPEECVVLENATLGIKAAKAAGCKCIAVINERTPSQDLSKADKVLKSLEEFLAENL